jgi:hypothetical protein
MIRALVPAIADRLQQIDKAKALELRVRHLDWRKNHPTHRQRLAAVEAKRAAIQHGLRTSRDQLLEAHGLKQTPAIRQVK